MARSDDPQDRRRYPRLQAPIYYRPTGYSIFKHDHRAVDISGGGMRIFTDDGLSKGARLELELFLPDKSSVVCRVEVVWVDPLKDATVARYDVGLKFTEIAPPDRERIAALMVG